MPRDSGILADSGVTLPFPSPTTLVLPAWTTTFGSKWHFYGSYRYFKLIRTTTNQTLLSANGLSSLATRPQVPWFLAAGLTTNVTSNFTNDFPLQLSAQLLGLGHCRCSAADLWVGRSSGTLGETSTQVLAPYNVNTQSVRTRFWNGHDSMIRDDATWLKGSHVIQFGGTYQRNWNAHQRTDNGGGLTTTPFTRRVSRVPLAST